MSSNDQVQAILATLEKHIGVKDVTLAEYILDLAKKGRDVLIKELNEFPSGLVQDAVSIVYGRRELSLKDELPKVGSTHTAVVAEPRPNGLSVEINFKNKKRTGLVLRCPSPELYKSGDIVQVRIEFVSDNSLKFSLLESPKSVHIQESNGEEHRSSKRKTTCHPIVRQQIPAFLKAESIATSRATEVKRDIGWLDKAAQHTSSKVFAASSAAGGPPLSQFLSQPQDAATVRLRGRQIKKQDSKGQEKKELPVHGFRTEIIEALVENPIIIVVGDTGSGKSTQLTQFLRDAGFTQNGKRVACTQPRRIAAISVAQRVNNEVGGRKVGGTVGYSVRFDNCTSNQTEIQYMTDGLLQREIMLDPDLSDYSVIMLDEAHERTVATDVLFALLKGAVARRPDLRVIVTSATLDAAKFGAYFGNAPILRIPGRMYPVEIEWSPEPVLDYMEATLSTVKRIHETKTGPDEKGDILVFLTGQAEIDLAVGAVADMFPKGDLIPIPVYAAIPDQMQSLIFDPAPPGKRKVVFATNIAETSLTIDGIRYVVDSGFAKVQAWDARKGMSVLRVQPISQAQANQRMGRAGRTGPGVCFRLYTQTTFEREMPPTTLPEIQRENLSNTVLMLKTMGINDVLSFDFMDPPPRNSLISAMHELYILNALDENAGLTNLGRSMASFPLEPGLSKVLLTAMQVGRSCLEDALTVIAMMSSPSVFYRPSHPADKRREADTAHRQLQDITSDHHTLLKVYNKWIEANYSRDWCTTHFLQFKNLQKVRDTRRQLDDLVKRSGHKVKQDHDNTLKSRKVNMLRALCSGFFQNVAKLDDQGSREGMDYVTLANETRVQIHPSSALFRQKPPFVLYNSLIMTSKEYMQTVSQIQPEWLLDAAPDYYKEADDEHIKKTQKTDSIKPLFTKNVRHENEWRVSEQLKTLNSKSRR